MGLVLAGALIASAGSGVAAPPQRALERDRQAIERLHRQDVAATLSDKADELAKLWDRDAVRLQAGAPAEVGRAVIHADDKRWDAKNVGHTLTYAPKVMEPQISGDWAFEWGYFDVSFKETPAAEKKTLHGKQLRVLKRQADGSWKFARVMSLVDPRK
jgi:ketosteroid isomerase-like protein